MKSEDPKKTQGGAEGGGETLSEAPGAMPGEAPQEEAVDMATESGEASQEDAVEATERTASGVGVFFLVLVVSAVLLLVAGWYVGKVSARDERVALAAEKDATISGQNATIAELNGTIEQKEAEIAAKEAEIKSNKARIKQLEWELMPVTAEGTAAARMYEFYGYHSYDRAPAFRTDEEFKEWCQEEHPEAVFPTNEWTVRDVVASWTENPEIWAKWHDNDYYYMGTWFCWTPDWQHCLILDADTDSYSMTDYYTGEHLELVTGWLVVDGLRVAPIDESTYDIEDPYEMLRQYRAGEWDGSPRRSHDGSTTVSAVPYSEGQIIYSYQAWFYDEMFNPEGTAWADFAPQPWWLGEDVPEEFASRAWASDSEKDWTEKNVRLRSGFSSGLYVDLPTDCEVSKDVYLSKSGGQTFYMDTKRVEVFQVGNSIYSWDYADFDFEFVANSENMRLYRSFREPLEEYAQDMAYLYDGSGHLAALRQDGSAKLMLDKMLYADATNAEFWGFRGNDLICWRLSAKTSPSVVGEDVLEVDFSTAVLFAKADGCYVVTFNRGENGDDYIYQAEYLGPLSLEDCAHMLEAVDAGLSFQYRQGVQF